MTVDYSELDALPVVQGREYRVQFEADMARQVESGLYTLVDLDKVARAGSSSLHPYEARDRFTLDPELLVTESPHHHHDGERMVLTMGPDSTEDDKHSSVEVPNTRRFDQQLLDHLSAIGAPNVMIPGRQAIWRDLVFSPHFADGRANRETVTTGVCWQSWRGIEEDGLMPTTPRPRFVVVWFSFLGGPGPMPALASRSFKRRVFWASVMDFNSGFTWFQPVPQFDPTTPHDVAIRWLPDRSISFTVDGREVAYYEDGKRRFYPLGLMSRQFGRGTDVIGHRFHAADPSHISAWITCMKMPAKISVPTGLRFHDNMWLALKGYEIEPLV